MGDYDKVYILPEYSEIERDQINLSSTIFNTKLKVPILSAPMDSVSKLRMLKAIRNVGGLGIHHRYCNPEILFEANGYGAIAVCPSMKMIDLENILGVGIYRIACLDVAHGDTKRNLEFCRDLKIMGWNVISGNICTVEGAYHYLKYGINYVRVGIGPGSVCLTRIVTGVGKPNYLAIPEIKHEFGKDIKIIADGGFRNTGDIAKGFALGSDYVMLGRMLAMTYEAENDGIYSGMASAPALKRNNKTEFFIEGKSEIIEVNKHVDDLFKEIKDGLETTCYYTGSKNVNELNGKYEIL